MNKCKLLLSLLVITMLLIAVLTLSSCEEMLASLAGSGSSENEALDDNADAPECKHAWSNYTSVTVPECGTEDKGLARSTCSKCSAVREMTINAYSQHHIDRTVTPAQCEIEGQIVDKCRNCDYISVEILEDRKSVV